MHFKKGVVVLWSAWNIPSLLHAYATFADVRIPFFQTPCIAFSECCVSRIRASRRWGLDGKNCPEKGSRRLMAYTICNRCATPQNFYRRRFCLISYANGKKSVFIKTKMPFCSYMNKKFSPVWTTWHVICWEFPNIA